MPTTTTVIIGAGHCGLAMSHCLAARSIDHVILERGEVANSWRTGRRDSLRLLTPNWMTRLPGYAYRGADPDGYLSARQVTAMLGDYADASGAPVLTGTTVTSVRAAEGGYAVRTDQGTWRAPAVVLACGAIEMRNPALDAWGDYDRDDPYPLFAQVRADGPVHEVTLADGHRAWLIVRHEEAKAALNHAGLSKDMHAALARDGAVVAEGLPGPAFAGTCSASTRPTTPGCDSWPRPRSAGRGSPPAGPVSRRSSMGCLTTSRHAATPPSTWSRASPSRCRSP